MPDDFLICYPEFCPVKRSSALRGRNRTRNNRTDGAPRRTAPAQVTLSGGRFVSTTSDTGGYASENPLDIVLSGGARQMVPSTEGYVLKKGSAGPPRRTAFPFLIGAFWLSVGGRSQLRFTWNVKLLDEVRQLAVSKHASLACG